MFIWRRNSLGRAARAVLVPALFLSTLAPGVASASTPDDHPIRSSPQDERTPVAGAGYLAWAENQPDFPRRYVLWVKRFDGMRIRVNPGATNAMAGGIDGTTLVYQQASGGRSEIRFYDLATGVSRRAPRAVNSAARQFGPSLSGGWLLFTRQFAEPTVWKILLYDMNTGRMRTLDRVSGPWARFAQSGQVAGDWATWQVCTPYCKVFVYRISTRQTFLVPNPDRHFQYAPSVTADGSVYFAESHAACGGVTIRRYRAGGRPVTLAALAPTTDLSFMSARVLRNGGTELLYDATRCSDFSGDLRALTLEPPHPLP
ncbi:MAG TPA: hypothetical protein VNN79_08135 [Actinomycetota bacterium]|nr:hypothetical protein [Actinomycetota bacterium]